MSQNNNFVAGRLKHFVNEWRKLTNDSNILDIVEHCHIDIDLKKHDFSTNTRTQYEFNEKEQSVINSEIGKLLELQVLVEVEPRIDQILSPIFLKPKKNGDLGVHS